jgi:predicted acetyltransferase
MPELIDPSLDLRQSFLEAVAEHRADRDFPVPWFVTDIDEPALTDATAFRAYVERLLGERADIPRAPRLVPQTTLWWVEGEQVLGRLALRHRLTRALESVGGHIGYAVRPTARRQGHATAMLAAALPLANALGITQALVTCDETNAASRRVIEANGGRYINSIGIKRRYWITTAAPDHSSGPFEEFRLTVEEQVVRPCLDIAFRPGELRHFSTEIGEDHGEARGEINQGPDIRLQLETSAGDVWGFYVWQAEVESLSTIRGMRRNLLSQLEDALPDSRLRWGEEVRLAAPDAVDEW